MLESSTTVTTTQTQTTTETTSTTAPQSPVTLLHSLLEDWERLKGAKERKETVDLIDSLIAWLKDPQNKDTPNMPISLQNQVTKQKTSWKEALSAWNKTSKHLQKILSLHDIHPPPKSPTNTTQMLNSAIADHFNRRGEFEIANLIGCLDCGGGGGKSDSSCCCTGTSNGSCAKNSEKYTKLHSLLTSLSRDRNIKPCLEWLEDNRLLLTEKSHSNLRLHLHRLEFISLLRDNSARMLSYAQNNLLPLSNMYIEEVQSLFGAIAFAPSFTSPQNPYISFLERDLWGEAEALLVETFLPLNSLYGQTLTSSLEEIIGAGQMALPSLSKVMMLMKTKPGVSWCPQDELPITVGVSGGGTAGTGSANAKNNTTAFHSIFVCPVLRQQSTPANPPMLMACGHVICKEALNKLGRGHQHQRIKCPYCPMEGTIGQAKELFFE